MNVMLTEDQQRAVGRLWADLEAIGGHRHLGSPLESAARQLRGSYVRALLCARDAEDELWREFLRLAVRVRALAPRGLGGEAALALRRLERIIAENSDLDVQVAALDLVV